MVLTPFLKFVLIAFVFSVNVMLWIWTGVQADAFALGLNEHVYNIVNVVISGMVTAGSALLAYVGLRAPTLPPRE
jgi:hypothetical protein